MNKQIKFGIVISGLLFIAVGLYAFVVAPNQKQEEVVTGEQAKKDVKNRALEVELGDVDKKLSPLPSDTEDQYELFMKKGDILQQLDKKREAKTAYEMAVNIDGTKSGAYKALYEMHLEADELVDAEANLIKFINLNIDSASRWELYLEYLAKINADSSRVEAVYTDSLTKVVNDKEMHIKYALYLVDKREIDKAKAILIKAGEIDPKNKPEYDAELAKIM